MVRVTGLTAALGGDSAVSTLAAQIEIENNYFGQKPEGFRAAEQQQFNEAMALCGPGNTDGCARARELSGISEQRDKELASACIDAASSLCRTAVQLATATGNVVFFDKQGKPIVVPLIHLSFRRRLILVMGRFTTLLQQRSPRG